MDLRVTVGQACSIGDRRVSHGLYRECSRDENESTRFRNDLWAWRQVLPTDATFTHLTAARALGLWLPPLPPGVPVFVATRGNLSVRRPGLICSRFTHPSSDRAAGPVPLDDMTEILLRCARDLGTLDLLVMIDSALRRGLVDQNALLAFCDQAPRPGVTRLRVATGWSDARAESPYEVLLRILHRVFEVAVTPQGPLVDKDGRQFGRGDLVVDGTPFVHEYDGAGHRDPGQHASDLRRERRMIAAGKVRRGYTLPDLIVNPAHTLAEIDEALGRPRRLRRLRAWQRLVDESLWSDVGQRRLVNRWARVVQRPDWA